jgi:hypothetical protein
MTQEAHDDRRLGVLCLTARTSVYHLPTTTHGTLLGEPTCEPVRDPQRSSMVGAVAVDAFSPALRGPRGMEDSACFDSEAQHQQDISPCFEA